MSFLLFCCVSFVSVFIVILVAVLILLNKNKKWSCKESLLETKERSLSNSSYRITTIITTAPTKHPNLDTHLLRTVKSLALVPELVSSPLIIGFDGLRVDNVDEIDPKCAHPAEEMVYKAYKNRARIEIRKLFPHAVFVESDRRVCLTRNLFQCFAHVRTEFVNVMQHDLPLIRAFPLDLILQLLRSGQHSTKMVRLSPTKKNQEVEDMVRNSGNKIVEPFTFSFMGQQFSRCSVWSDQNHIASKQYYESVVFPKTLHKNSFMEHELLLKPPDDFETYGTYYLGDYEDGGYSLHTDGRNN